LAQQGLGEPVIDTNQPALISADELVYNERFGIVTARGNVEISQGPRILRADSVSYNLRSDVVTASGNVALMEPSGEVLFANHAEVTGDLREAFVRDVGVLLSDQGRFAALSATVTEDGRTELRKAVYSPCKLCEEDPTAAPLWQIKAYRVIRDEDSRTITYQDAFLEVFGFPVLYTPYLQHPDPTVKRQSGFLAPRFGTSTALGLSAEIPYFVVLSPTADVTLSPIFATRQFGIAKGQYRQLFRRGFLEMNGSATAADRENADGTIDENAFRGHIRSTFDYDIDETYRLGIQLDAASDDTYLRTFNLSSPTTLFSKAAVEGFRGRDYVQGGLFGYQSLSAEDATDEIPIALPLLSLNQVSEPTEAGGFFSLDASLVNLVRITGRDTRRISMTGAYTLPFTTTGGQVYEVKASLQGSGYWANDFDPALGDDVTPADGQTVVSGRINPLLSVQWSYPWIGNLGSWQQIVEPRVQGLAALPNNNSDRIPNEDSSDLEFDDTNLFDDNFFPGVDRVQPGPRVDYGLNWALIGSEGAEASVFFGQSYRFLDDEGVFPTGSGLENKLSNIVGRFQASPVYWLDAAWQFSYDIGESVFDRSEVQFGIGTPDLRLDMGYLFTEALNDSDGSEVLPKRNQLEARLSGRIDENWSGFASHLQDFEANQALRTRVGFAYTDECIRIEAIYERRNFDDRELDPDNAFFVTVSLTHIGDLAGF